MKYLKEKIKRSYQIGGLRFSILTVIINFLRKIENETIYLFKTLKYKNKKDILIKVHDFEMILDSKCKGIQKQLLINGDREMFATKTLKKEMKKGDVVLEAGANIGYYVILESKKIENKGLIYAVEPGKENYSRLKKNVRYNRLKNVKIYNLAFGDRKRDAFLEISPLSNMNRVIKKNEELPSKTLERIKLISIDSFLKNKKKPDIVRMDVEGYEYYILKGMQKLLRENPPRMLYIETHLKHMGKEKSREFLLDLKKYDYEIKHCFLYEIATSKIPFLNLLDKKRLNKILKQKITIDDLLKREFDMNYLASLEIFFEYKGNKDLNVKKANS